MIKSTTDGDVQHSQPLGAFCKTVKFVRDKYGSIAVDDESVILLGEDVNNLLPVEWRDSLEALIGLLST
jgi:hypothetical protein